MAGYGNDADFQAWLTAQGLTMPVGAPPIAVLRQIGSDYVDSAYEHRLKCSSRTGGFSQERAWPRTGHSVGCDEVPPDLIPQPWINASYRAAYLQATSAFVTDGGRDPSRITKREKVDVLEREFFAHGEAGQTGNASPGFPVDPMIDGWVSMWLCPDGGSFAFMVV